MSGSRGNECCRDKSQPEKTQRNATMQEKGERDSETKET